MSQAICPSFPELVHTAVERSEPSCTPAQWYVCARRGMLLLLASPILFQRLLWYRSWSFKPFRNLLVLDFEMSHDQHNATGIVA